MKKILCVLFAAAILSSALPFAAYAEETENSDSFDFSFEYEDEEQGNGIESTLPTDLDIDFTFDDEESSNGTEDTEIEFTTEDEESSNGTEDTEIEFTTEDEETSNGTEDTEIEFTTEDEETSNGTEDTEIEFTTEDEETSNGTEDTEIAFTTEDEETSNGTDEIVEKAEVTENTESAEEIESTAVESVPAYSYVSLQATNETPVYTESTASEDDFGVVILSLKAVVKNDKKTVKLSWKKVEDATGYKVCRTYTDENGKKTTKVYDTKKLTFKNTTSASGNYTYKVRAYKTVDGKNVYGAYSKVVK